MHFDPEVVHFYPWEGLEDADTGLRGRAEVYVHGGGAGRDPLVCLPVDRLEEVRGFLRDPATRRNCPTFRHPDGPAVAVLAGVRDDGGAG